MELEDSNVLLVVKNAPENIFINLEKGEIKMVEVINTTAGIERLNRVATTTKNNDPDVFQFNRLSQELQRVHRSMFFRKTNATIEVKENNRKKGNGVEVQYNNHIKDWGSIFSK